MATVTITVEKRRHGPVKLTASHRLYALGAIQLVALLICSRRFNGDGEAFPIAPLCVAGIAYLLSVREFFRTPTFPKRVIVIGLAFAAVGQIAFLAIPTGSDDDVRRYVWDGRVQHLGYSPYVVAPAETAVAALHTPETRTLNNPEVPSPYPPGAQLFFRAVTAVHESALAFRMAFALCNVAIVLALLDILHRTGQPAHWILAYAWHPLLATEVVGSGHVDILGALLLVLSLAALLHNWRSVSAIAFALAVAVKFLPIVLLPLYWRRIRVCDAALATIVFALVCLPYLDHGHIPTGSLGTYIQSFRFNGPVFIMLEHVLAPQIVAFIALLVGLLTALSMRRRFAQSSRVADGSHGVPITRSSERQIIRPSDSFAWPMAASLFCAPVVYPWYLLWILPFTRSTATLPLIVWSVSIIPTYMVWHLRTRGHTWGLPGWVMWFEYGTVALAAAFLLVRRYAPRSTG